MICHYNVHNSFFLIRSGMGANTTQNNTFLSVHSVSFFVCFVFYPLEKKMCLFHSKGHLNTCCFCFCCKYKCHFPTDWPVLRNEKWDPSWQRQKSNFNNTGILVVNSQEATFLFSWMLIAAFHVLQQHKSKNAPFYLKPTKEIVQTKIEISC